MPSRIELVAHDRNEEEIAAHIGADHVIFQKLPDLIRSVSQFNPALTTFDCSVFTGEYVTGGVDEGYLAHLEGLRADNVRSKAQFGNIGALEGKGGGGTANVNGLSDASNAGRPCSGPMNGADDNLGLHNSWNA